MKEGVRSADAGTQEQIAKLQEAVQEREQLKFEMDGLRKEIAEHETTIRNQNAKIEQLAKDHEDLMELYIRAEG